MYGKETLQILENAEQMFHDEYNDTCSFRSEDWWKLQPEEVKALWICRAKSEEPYKEGGYCFAQQTPGWGHAYFLTQEEEIDWKDFRYNVCKTHTWLSSDEDLTVAIGSFEAWRSQVTMETEDEPEKSGEVIPFRPQPELAALSGGKDGEGNWLQGLEEGAVFVSRPKKLEGPDAEQWHVSIKWKKSTVLHYNFPHGEGYRLVETLRFSRQNDLVEILQERKQEGPKDG